MGLRGDPVQLEHSGMRLALKMAKMATGVFLRPAIEETQHQIKMTQCKVWEEKERVAEFPAHTQVKAAIQWNLAMLRQNQTNGCLLWHMERQESVDIRAAESYACTSAWLKQTADTRTNAIAFWNTNCATQSPTGSSKFPNWHFATQICVFTHSSSQLSIGKSQCI